jgi:hypothetical protein
MNACNGKNDCCPNYFIIKLNYDELMGRQGKYSSSRFYYSNKFTFITCFIDLI